MATLKTISNRIKSVKNIRKITKSMQMVSAAKYAQALQELHDAIPFGVGAQAFYDKLEVPDIEEDEDTQKLIIGISSDRGLCGMLHTQVSSAVKNEIESSDGKTKVICVGDRMRSLVQYTHRKHIVLSGYDIGKKKPTFLDASEIALQALKFKFNLGKILYNKYVSAISFKVSEIPVFPETAVLTAPNALKYESLDSDVLDSYLEFSLASLIFYTLKESACSEHASRMQTMDNASRNAGDMIDMLTLTYNRTRQAVITKELVEIISGASAVQQSN